MAAVGLRPTIFSIIRLHLPSGIKLGVVTEHDSENDVHFTAQVTVNDVNIEKKKFHSATFDYLQIKYYLQEVDYPSSGLEAGTENAKIKNESEKIGIGDGGK